MERAMRLPQQAEPLVTEAVDREEVDSYATRQMRRRARRAQAKAERGRRPAKVLHDAVEAETAVADAPVEVPAAASIAVPIEAPPQQAAEAAASPLPSNRALVRRPSGLIDRLFGGWLLRRPAKVARCDPDTLTEQMLVLRTELALVQSRLERMIAATVSG